MSAYDPCFVCWEPIDDGDEPHTNHDPRCPAARDVDAECALYGDCGPDVHEGCCPTCKDDEP
jgi:hypothetical protein